MNKSLNITSNQHLLALSTSDLESEDTIPPAILFISEMVKDLAVIEPAKIQ